MCSDCTWSGEKQSPFPPPWHLGQVMRSPWPPPTPLQQHRGFRVQLQSGFSNRPVLMASAAERKLPLGASSLSKENGPRPVRSYEGCAGTGAGEETETVATLGCAAARSGAGLVMQPFARPQCVVPGWPALPRPFPSRGVPLPVCAGPFSAYPPAPASSAAGTPPEGFAGTCCPSAPTSARCRDMYGHRVQALWWSILVPYLAKHRPRQLGHCVTPLPAPSARQG